MRVSRPLASCLTYTLGSNLYVPLTSRCNTRTLPETRGPNFLLPAHVVSALCRVRDLEQGTQQWTHWCMYLDSHEGVQKLPAALDPIPDIPKEKRIERLPTVENLVKEIQDQQQQRQSNDFDSVVIAGEGEPTLRLDDLLDLVVKLRALDYVPPIRLTSNGLVASEYEDDVPRKLAESGISHVSVALMTADPSQYEQLMNPLLENAHARVCRFIEQSIQAGLDVEITAVDRTDVDKEKTEDLSRSLKVTSPVRWRPFFE